MKEKKTTFSNFLVWVRKHRLIIMTIILFVIFPIILLTSLFITTYQSNKVTAKKLFEVDDAIFVNQSYLKNRFDFEFYVSTLIEPAKDKDGKPIGGAYEFYMKATRKEGNKSIPIGEQIRVRVAEGANWVNFKTNATNGTTFNLDGTAITNHRLTMSKDAWPKRTLGIISIKHPKLYVLLEWTETHGETKETKKVILTYSYARYITDDTVKEQYEIK